MINFIKERMRNLSSWIKKQQERLKSGFFINSLFIATIAILSASVTYAVYANWFYACVCLKWFVNLAVITLQYIIQFLTWEFGPILIYWRCFTMTIEILYESIEYFTVFYSSFINFINSNDFTLEWFFDNFKILIALNSLFYQLIACFIIITLLLVSEKWNIFAKKFWFYSTIFTFVVTLMNLHYINPLQLKSSDYANSFYNSLFVEKVESVEHLVAEQLMLSEVHNSQRIGLLLCVLVGYVFVLCAYLKQTVCTKQEILLYVALEFFLLKAFTTMNMLEFYIYYEAVLIPMYLLIIGWGSGEAKKGLAAYYLMFYTIIFSIPFLVAILYLGYKANSYDVILIKKLTLSFNEEFYIFLALFLGFAVKIPMFPFHIWLPEAHVNAPTTASVILASLLLKLGGYGMIQFLLPICKNACFHYLPFIYAIIIISIIYSSMAAIVQTDLKRIIAYSSIAHMNLAILGIFSWNCQGLQGSVYQMISHGITSAGLFFLIGFLYDRHHTRDITYYGGLATVMPLYSTSFFFFSIANMGFPGTSAFVGELLIFIGAFKHNTVVGSFALIGAFLSAVYSIWLFNRVCFGSLNTAYLGKRFFDLTRQELFVILYLFIPLITLGVYPSIILDYLGFLKHFF